MIKSDETFFYFTEYGFKIRRIDLYQKYKLIEEAGNLSNGLVGKTLSNKRNNPETIRIIAETIKRIMPDKVIGYIVHEKRNTGNSRIPVSHNVIN